MPVIVNGSGLAILAKRLAEISRDADKDFKQAIGTLRRAATTEAKRAVSAIYSLTQARVDKGLVVRSKPDGVEITGRKRPVTFVSYGWRQTPVGLRGKIIRKSKVSEFKSGFIANGLRGEESGNNRVAFFRSGAPRRMKLGRYAGKMRQPLVAIYGPSIADAVNDSRVSVPLTTQLLGRAAQELRRRIKKALTSG